MMELAVGSESWDFPAFVDTLISTSYGCGSSIALMNALLEFIGLRYCRRGKQVSYPTSPHCEKGTILATLATR